MVCKGCNNFFQSTTQKFPLVLFLYFSLQSYSNTSLDITIDNRKNRFRVVLALHPLQEPACDVGDVVGVEFRFAFTTPPEDC